MRADGDTACLGQKDRVVHDGGVAGIEAACDIGRRNDVHQVAIIANGIGAEALAHIAVQVDGRHGNPRWMGQQNDARRSTMGIQMVH